MDTVLKADLQNALHPLASSEDNGRFDDLAFLPEVLKDVRIVGLGEGSHGMREHFQFKHRILRFLVENMGYRTFMIEAALDACDVINDYVMYGRGDKAAALAGQHFWTWDTEEVSAMIDWMREHNMTCDPGEEVSFLGFDIQSCDVAKAYLIKHLLPVAETDSVHINSKADGEKLRSILEDLDKKRGKDSREDLPDAAFLLGWVSGHEHYIREKTSTEEYMKIYRYARYIFQHIDCLAKGSKNEPRDLWMYENVVYQLEEMPKGGKIVLWAHNGHMSAQYIWKTMGSYLKDRYGSQYYPIGFTVHEGTFQSRYFNRDPKPGEIYVGKLQAFDVPEIGENLYEYDLDQLSKGNFFIDMRSATRYSEAVRNWAETPKAFLMLDEAMDPVHSSCYYEIPMTLSKSFDGILHTEKVTRSRPNPTGLRETEVIC